MMPNWNKNVTNNQKNNTITQIYYKIKITSRKNKSSLNQKKKKKWEQKKHLTRVLKHRKVNEKNI